MDSPLSMGKYEGDFARSSCVTLRRCTKSCGDQTHSTCCGWQLTMKSDSSPITWSTCCSNRFIVYTAYAAGFAPPTWTVQVLIALEASKGLVSRGNSGAAILTAPIGRGEHLLHLTKMAEAGSKRWAATEQSNPDEASESRCVAASAR